MRETSMLGHLKTTIASLLGQTHTHPHHTNAHTIVISLVRYWYLLEALCSQTCSIRFDSFIVVYHTCVFASPITHTYV